MGRPVLTISMVLDTTRASGPAFSSPVSSEQGTPRDEAVAALEREQAQRREVGTVQRLREALEGGVRLAAVGRADVERDAPAELARDGKAVGITLEGQIQRQPFERDELGDALLPAVLRLA